MANLIDWVIANESTVISVASLVTYEVFSRLKPTAKDWSLINIIKKIVDLIPNKASDGAKH